MTLIAHAKAHVAKNIEPQFHQKRLDKLEALKLDQILRRKNPYLFRATAVETASELVRQLLDAHLSSTEEALFGDFLEGLAISVCLKAFGGRKSTTEDIDLEFERDGHRYVVAIKSGPNWGNSSQIRKMIDGFNKARRIAGPRHPIIAVNGCCYGRDTNPEKERGNYSKLCGQEFWELISGQENLYVDLIEPIGERALLRNQAFSISYAAVLNKFTLAFAQKFCLKTGHIDWEALLVFNSGSTRVRVEGR
jgi:Type II restriction endonuclease EcoO109I